MTTTNKETSFGLVTGRFMGLFLPKSSRNIRKAHEDQKRIAEKMTEDVRAALELKKSMKARTMSASAETTNDDPAKIASGSIKYDAGKPATFQGLIDYFPRAIDSVARVSTFGASKYAWKGWEGVDDGINRYSNAMVRHLIQESSEGHTDPDSGLLHAAHVAWNALARLELKLRETKNEQNT